ncbi:MAG: hypothetical protein AAB425_00865, partial [Bdellovibrionota bacterium]
MSQTLVVAGGQSGNLLVNDSGTVFNQVLFAETTNLSTWTQVGTLTNAASFLAGTLRDGAGIHFLAGNNRPGVIVSSSDFFSISRSPPTSFPTLPTAVMGASAAYFNRRIYLMGGMTSSGITSQVYSSDDGLSWAEAGSMPGAKTYGAAVVLNGVLYYFGGSPNGAFVENSDAVYKTTDGASWTTHSSTGPSGATGVSLAVHGGLVFSCGGMAGTSVSSA